MSPHFTNDRDAKFYACNEGKNQIDVERDQWNGSTVDYFVTGAYKVNQFYRLLSLYYDDRLRFFKITGQEYFDYDEERHSSGKSSGSVRGFIE